MKRADIKRGSDVRMRRRRARFCVSVPLRLGILDLGNKFNEKNDNSF
jgi:hypothetical protein